MTEETLSDSCDFCRLVPLDQLGLEPPLGGWERALADRGVVVLADDVGRASIVRSAARQLHRERADRERRVAEEAERRSAEADARRIKVPSVPALEGASPLESMAAAGGLVSPAEEFGNGRVSPARQFMDEQFAEGHRSQAEAKEKARLAKQMREKL